MYLLDETLLPRITPHTNQVFFGREEEKGVAEKSEVV